MALGASITSSETTESASIGSWLLTLTSAIVAYLISQYFRHGLQRYPGPFLAKFTRLWYFFSVKSYKHHEDLIRLHRRYGDVVRIGPGLLSIARPDYVSRVYSLQSGYTKGPMYDVFAQRVNGRRMSTTLSQRDAKLHVQMTRPIAGAYKFSALVNYEPLINEVCGMLLKKIDSVIGDSKSCTLPFDLWARIFALDMILYLTFGAPMGFIEAGGDVDGIFARIDDGRDKNVLLCTVPWTLSIIKFNPIVAYFASDSSTLSKWCIKQVYMRQAERVDGAKRKDDFLDKFLDAATIESSPPRLDLPKLLDWSLVNVNAGSDTVTIALRSVVYHLLKTPEKKAKLVSEIQAADLSYPISYAAAQKLPYLDACIKEALRIHPPIGLGMERVTNNLQMPDGYTLPPGTVVSMTPWVVGRQDLFGEDADEFRPERWLQASNESQESYQERLKAWKRADLVFSAGAHSCTGKYVAYMEMYKLIPTLLIKYDLALKHPDADWEVFNRFVVKQQGIDVIFTPRK